MKPIFKNIFKQLNFRIGLIYCVLFLFILISSNVLAQTALFTNSKSSAIETGEVITITNTSENVPDDVTFFWEFSECAIIIDSILYCDYETTDLEEQLNLSFSFYGDFDITLTLKDVDGNVLDKSEIVSFNVLPGFGCQTSCNDLFPFSCTNQNLLCNPSFEWKSSNVSAQGQLWKSEPWCNIASSDIFEPNATQPNTTPSILCSTPVNDMGMQIPKSGDNYAGLIAMTFNDGLNNKKPNNFSEYIFAPIKNTTISGSSIDHLIAGQRYRMSFYFSMADYSQYATDGLQVYFSSNVLNNNSGSQVYVQSTIDKLTNASANNVLNPFEGQIIDNKTETWTHFNEVFVPNDNTLKYINIGYFRKLSYENRLAYIQNNNTNAVPHYERNGDYSLKGNAYYYIDDVSLTPLPPEVSISGPSEVCAGTEIQLYVSGVGANSYQWNNGQNTPYITVTPNQTTTYSVTAYDYYGCNEVTVSKKVVVNSPVEPVISGTNNDCNGSDDLVYQIDNYNSSCTYNWSILSGSGTFNNTSATTATGPMCTIDWTNIPSLPNHATIQVLCIDENGCKSVSEFNVFPCCELDDINYYWTDETISSISSIEGKRILINGTVTLDTDIEFKEDNQSNNTQIFMGPEAKLKVANNRTVEFIENTELNAGCVYFWDGVYLNGGNSVVIMNNSFLGYSENGITGRNNSVLKISNSNFRNNKKSICFIDYDVSLSSYNGYIYNNNIYVDGLNAPQANDDYYLNMEPYMNSQAFTGIYLENSTKIKIGDVNYGANNFNKLKNGIYSVNSSAVVKNNNFDYINYVGNAMSRTPFNAAIYGKYWYKKSLNYSVPKDFTIGDASLSSGGYSNYFNNCDVGVFLRNHKPLIYTNKFLNVENSSIYLYDITTGAKVNFNYMKNSSTNNCRGIVAHNTSARRMSFEILDNHIRNMKWGISLINCESLNSIYKVKVEDNYIAINPTFYSGVKYGIRAAGCNRIEIADNTITRMGTVSSTDAQKVIGISLRHTQSAKVYDNHMFKMGSGIKTNGAMYNTQYYCNTFSNSYHGFYFGQQSALTNFGWKNVPNVTDFNPHNKWWNNFGEKMATAPNNIINTFPVDYYFYGPNSSGYSVDFNPEILTNSSCYNDIIPFVNNSATYYCGNSQSPLTILDDDEITTDEERDLLLEEYLLGEEYLQLQEEYRSYEIEYLFEVLDNDTNILWLGSEDADYQDFYNEYRNSINYDFIEIDNLIEEGSHEEAYSLNNSINPGSLLEANRKNANRIYLETYINEDFELSNNTESELMTIANLTPYEGGYGVFTARVMLDYDPDENEASWRISEENSLNSDILNLKVYPNPAEDFIIFELMDELDDYNANIEIFNSMGQLIKSDIINNRMEKINTTGYNPGIYFYSIKYNEGFTVKGKFIIN